MKHDLEAGRYTCLFFRGESCLRLQDRGIMLILRYAQASVFQEVMLQYWRQKSNSTRLY